MNEKMKKALAQIPYPVSVVTLGTGGAESGLTVSWLSQVSHEPPMLMISIDKNHFSQVPLDATGNFVVNLLGKDQKEIAGRFAKQSMEGDNKLEGLATREAESGTPILTEALAYFDCEVTDKVEAGGHTLVIGKVIDADVLHEGDPLTSASGLRYRK